TQEFAWVHIIPEHTSDEIGMPITVVSPTSGNSSDVTLRFENFNPGDQVAFRVELTPATPSDTPFADYRNIFFKLGGGSDTSQNAETTATFSHPDSDDPIVAGPYVWENPPGNPGDTVFGIAFSCLTSPDVVIRIPP